MFVFGLIKMGFKHTQLKQFCFLNNGIEIIGFIDMVDIEHPSYTSIETKRRFDKNISISMK